MTDDFAICPACGLIEAGWDDVTDDGFIIKCQECHATYPSCELLWKFYDFERPDLVDFDYDNDTVADVSTSKFY